jgi:hypothetical protein
MLIAVILGGEVAFWLFLLAGLSARYLLRMRKLGLALLCGTVLVDVVVLGATVLHLRGGATADFTHGLAAAYLGFSIMFGHAMIRWADVRFAHKFAGGPPPVKIPKSGPVRIRHEWVTFAKTAGAWAISCALLVAGIVWVDDATRTEALEGWIFRLTWVLGICSLWPITYTLFPERATASR